MKSFRFLALMLAITATFSTAVFASTTDSVTVKMKALNGSGENGTAIVTQKGDNLVVVVNIKGAPAGVEQPTHIHAGNCGNINKAPEYPLSNTVDGKGSSEVKGVKLTDLMTGKYAINVHKSADDLGTYVSCGNING